MTSPLDPYPWTTKSPEYVAPRFAKRPHNHPDGPPVFRPREGYEQDPVFYSRDTLMGKTVPTSEGDAPSGMTTLDPMPWTLNPGPGHYFQVEPRFPRQPIGHPDGSPAFRPRSGYEQNARLYPTKVLMGASEQKDTTVNDDIEQYLTPMADPIAEPTDAEVEAFTEAWGLARQKIGRGIARKGTKTRAGLRAAYAARKDRLHAAAEESNTAQEERERTPLQQDTEKQMVPQALVEAIEKETEAQEERISLWSQAGRAQEAIRRDKITSAKITATASPGTKPPAQTAEGLRTNALSLLALGEPSEHTDLSEVRRYINELARLATPAPDITDGEIYGERQHQISQGYSASHDDEHGIRHLLLWAIQYGKQHKSVESLALIRAALESMARRGIDL